MIEALLAYIAPHSCCSCGNLGTVLCQICKNDIVSDPFSCCLLCLGPTMDGDLCKKCQTTTGISGGWCVGTRQGHLKALLDRYKFDSARQAGRLCGELLSEQLPEFPESFTVVPVPTSPAHQRTRGFDHTALVARRFAELRQLPYQQALTRVDSGTQHFKTRTERLQTAARGLGVRGNVPETVLLVDDIYTTGATLMACAGKLREHGVKQLFVAVIARQVLDEGNDLW
jgi:ComF family protein